MGLAELVAPEAPPHRHDGQLGEDDGAPDGGGDLLGVGGGDDLAGEPPAETAMEVSGHLTYTLSVAEAEST